jgi:C-terminal processing protease CtpA/Prc
MVSTNNPWNLLREQLMQIEETMVPSAPFSKEENHWIEFDINIFLEEKLGCWITVNELNHSIVITNIFNNHDGLIHPFDIILSLNDINFIDITQQTAQCIINAHRGKQIKIHIRRLQSTALETIEFHLHTDRFFDSRKLGFTINGGIRKTDRTDPGLFIIGIKPKSRAANNGRLRIGDRLMQISNIYTTINLQCIEFKKALKLIHRMRKESTSMTIVVAHQG